MIVLRALGFGGFLVLLAWAGRAHGNPDEASDIAEITSRQIKPNDVLDDPSQDGWDTEVFNDLAAKQFKQLGLLITDLARLETADLAALAGIADPGFHCTTLHPELAVESFADNAVTVRRATAGPAAPGDPQASPFRAPEGLKGALRGLAELLRGTAHVKFKFKTWGVEPRADGVELVTDFEASGWSETRSVQINQTWRSRWTAAEPGKLPLVQWIGVEDFELVEGRSPHGRLFADCTEAVLGANDSFQRQLKYGLNHWWGRLELALGMWPFPRYGLSVGDVNGDGLEDVYVCQPATLPNRLYVQNPDGTATDRSAEAGVDFLDHTGSALFLDLDADGDQDLVVATMENLLLLENDGAGHFTIRTRLATRADVQSMVAADYDLDGDIDIYLCIDESWTLQDLGHAEGKFLYFDATDGGPDHLFRNEGGWAFVDATQETGLDAGNNRHSLAACWEDYDNDGDPDLYVANDFAPNYLWRNDGGHFIEVAQSTGVQDYGSGMSADWGDFNRDGIMDLYVGNMWSSAGRRIMYQAQFRGHEDANTLALYRRFAKGNSLFRARGDGTFEEVSSAAAVELGRWAWSSNFADINNDGWEDIYVTNGYITSEDTGDL